MLHDGTTMLRSNIYYLRKREWYVRCPRCYEMVWLYWTWVNPHCQCPYGHHFIATASLGCKLFNPKVVGK